MLARLAYPRSGTCRSSLGLKGDSESERIDEAFALNFTVVRRLTQAVLPEMRSQLVKGSSHV